MPAQHYRRMLRSQAYLRLVTSCIVAEMALRVEQNERNSKLLNIVPFFLLPILLHTWVHFVNKHSWETRVIRGSKTIRECVWISFINHTPNDVFDFAYFTWHAGSFSQQGNAVVMVFTCRLLMCWLFSTAREGTSASLCLQWVPGVFSPKLTFGEHNFSLMVVFLLIQASRLQRRNAGSRCCFLPGLSPSLQLK